MNAQQILDSRKTLPVRPLPIEMKETEGSRGVISLATIKELPGRSYLLVSYK